MQGPEDAIAALTRELSALRSLDDVMLAVSRSVRRLLRADGATFVLRDGDHCYYAEEDAISPLAKGGRFPIGSCISGWCMKQRQAVPITDIYKDPRVPADLYRPTFVRSLIMAPVGPGEAMAALGAYWAETREHSREEVEQLQAIADAAGAALTKMRSAVTGGASEASPRPRSRSESPPAGFGDDAVAAFITRVRRKGLRPNSIEPYAFAFACVLISTLVREAFVASGAHGIQFFSTFYPAVLLSMLIGGRGAGIFATVLGGLAAYYFFMPPLYHFVPPSFTQILNFTLYGGSCALIILIIDWYKRRVSRLAQEDAKHLTLAREQSHRVKNAVAVVESVVRQSLRDHPEQARLVTGRIRAGLAQIDLQDEGADQPETLRGLLAVELEPYDLDRFTFQGRATTKLPPKIRHVLSLIAHELATNAVKYGAGALSVPGGHVTVAWTDLDGRLGILWTETGGPRVRPPQKRGYGSVLLQRLVHSAGGALAVDYQPTGVAADISFAHP
jgi:two-component sensor histidine kinase